MSILEHLELNFLNIFQKSLSYSYRLFHYVHHTADAFETRNTVIQKNFSHHDTHYSNYFSSHFSSPLRGISAINLRYRYLSRYYHNHNQNQNKKF